MSVGRVEPHVHGLGAAFTLLLALLVADMYLSLDFCPTLAVVCWDFVFIPAHDT